MNDQIPLWQQITSEQMESLKGVFLREIDDRESAPNMKSFEDFKGSISEVFFGDGAITVQWAGIHLCIEQNGYCHS